MDREHLIDARALARHAAIQGVTSGLGLAAAFAACELCLLAGRDVYAPREFVREGVGHALARPEGP